VVATVVSAVLLGLVACFFAVVDGGPLVGLVERVAAGAQSVWPLVVVGSILARRDRAAAPVGAGRRS
jgi:hypothetical protein